MHLVLSRFLPLVVFVLSRLVSSRSFLPSHLSSRAITSRLSSFASSRFAASPRLSSDLSSFACYLSSFRLVSSRLCSPCSSHLVLLVSLRSLVLLLVLSGLSRLVSSCLFALISSRLVFSLVPSSYKKGENNRLCLSS